MPYASYPGPEGVQQRANHLNLSTDARPSDCVQPWLSIESARWLRVRSASTPTPAPRPAGAVLGVLAGVVALSLLFGIAHLNDERKHTALREEARESLLAARRIENEAEPAKVQAPPRAKNAKASPALPPLPDNIDRDFGPRVADQTPLPTVPNEWAIAVEMKRLSELGPCGQGALRRC